MFDKDGNFKPEFVDREHQEARITLTIQLADRAVRIDKFAILETGNNYDIVNNAVDWLKTK